MFYNLQFTTSDKYSLYTDASSTIGYRGYFAGQWFSESWSVDKKSTINTDDMNCQSSFVNYFQL